MAVGNEQFAAGRLTSLQVMTDAPVIPVAG
jgi:hypothetical protein